jgi:hypothetical protein
MEENDQFTESKFQDGLSQVYFDVAGIDVSRLTEHHIARMITKVVVSVFTVWWSVIELRNLYNMKKTLKGD